MAYIKRNNLLPNLGLDVTKPAEYIDDHSAPSGQNVRINRGVLEKRYGTTALGAVLGETVMGFSELLKDATRYVLRLGTTKVQLLTESTSTWTDVCPATNSFVVSAANNKLNFNIGAAELTATITNGTYVMGTSQATAASLCKAIYDAIVAAEATGTYTVTHNGKNMIITRSAGTLSLLWKTGTNGADGTDTHIGTLCGYSDAADDTGALTYTADTAVYYPLTATATDPIDFATPLLSGARVLVFTNFVDNIRKYTGTGNTADLGGSPPKAKYLTEYGAYLVLAHIEDTGTKYRMRVQWCNTGLIEDWTGTNAGSQDLLEDGNDITGLTTFGNYVCVHKESCIYLGYLVTTSDVFKFDRISTGVGTICNNTVQNLNTGEQIFLARDGIRVFNGTSTTLAAVGVSDEIRESINAEYIEKCWSVVIPEIDEYWVGIPIGSQTSADTVYKYNYKTGQCFKDSRSNITCAGKYQRTTGLTWDDDSGTWDAATDRWDDTSLSSQHYSVVLGDSSGYCQAVNASYNNDNGTAITAYRDTIDFEGSEKGKLVRWLGMQLLAKGNTLDVKYSTDAGTTWNDVETLTLNSVYPTDASPVYSYFDVVSSKIRFRFYNAVAGETWAIKDFVLEYKEREMRR